MTLFTSQSRSLRSRALTRRPRCKPVFEMLEDRATPAVLFTADPNAFEGVPYAITLDEPAPNVTAYNINWGDGQSQTVLVSELSADRQVPHTYADGPNQYRIDVQAVTPDGVLGNVATYHFDENFTTAGTPVTLVGDVHFDPTSGDYRFAEGSGVAINTADLLARDEFSIEVVFRLDLTSDFRKVIDLDNRFDLGLYVNDNQIRYYPMLPSGSILPNEYHSLLMTRAASSNLVVLYLDGNEISRFSDTSFLADIGEPEIIHFFLDDQTTDGMEASAGNVKQIRLFSTALTPEQVADLDFQTTVSNVAPAVTAAATQDAVRNVTKNFDLGSFADVGADSPWQVSVDWGDGSDDSSFSVSSAGALGASHAYGASGDHTVTVTVTDKDGGVGTATFTVNVTDNIPPSDVAIAVDAGPFSEGDVVGLTVTFADPDDGQAHSLVIDFGDGQSETVELAAGVFSYTTTHTYADSGSFSIQASVADPFNAVASASANLDVANISPVYAPGPKQTGQINLASINLGSFTDAGLVDGPWSVTVSWGDGTSETFEVLSQGALTRGHDYAQNGRHTVTVTVTDKDGGSASGCFEITVAGSRNKEISVQTVLKNFRSALDAAIADWAREKH